MGVTRRQTSHLASTWASKAGHSSSSFHSSTSSSWCSSVCPTLPGRIALFASCRLFSTRAKQRNRRSNSSAAAMRRARWWKMFRLAGADGGAAAAPDCCAFGSTRFSSKVSSSDFSSAAPAPSRSPAAPSAAPDQSRSTASTCTERLASAAASPPATRFVKGTPQAQPAGSCAVTVLSSERKSVEAKGEAIAVARESQRPRLMPKMGSLSSTSSSRSTSTRFASNAPPCGYASDVPTPGCHTMLGIGSFSGSFQFSISDSATPSSASSLSSSIVKPGTNRRCITACTSSVAIGSTGSCACDEESSDWPSGMPSGTPPATAASDASDPSSASPSSQKVASTKSLPSALTSVGMTRVSTRMQLSALSK